MPSSTGASPLSPTSPVSPMATHNGHLAPGAPATPTQIGAGTHSLSGSHRPLLNPNRSPSPSPSPPRRADSTGASLGASQALHPGCVLCGLVASAGSTAGAPDAGGYSSNVGYGGFSASSTLPSPTSPATSSRALPSPVTPIARTPDQAGPSSQPYNPVRTASPSPSPRPFSPRIGNGNSLPLGSNGSMSPAAARQQQLSDIFVSGRRIIYRDELVTVYPAEGKEALCANGRHIIIVLNTHFTSVYNLGANDVPLLSHLIRTAQRLLLGAARASPVPSERAFTSKDLRVGFVNGMPSDPRSPHAHLHAQAFLGPFDKSLPGSTLWRRNIVFGTLNWWEIEDLRAEIREETSNNRVKSGYDERLDAPIDKVPDAGAIEGLPNALDPDEYADDPPEIRISHDTLAPPTRPWAGGSTARSTTTESEPPTPRANMNPYLDPTAAPLTRTMSNQSTHSDRSTHSARSAGSARSNRSAATLTPPKGKQREDERDSMELEEIDLGYDDGAHGHGDHDRLSIASSSSGTVTSQTALAA